MKGVTGTEATAVVRFFGGGALTKASARVQLGENAFSTNAQVVDVLGREIMVMLREAQP